jgi:hypothetical protein
MVLSLSSGHRERRESFLTNLFLSLVLGLVGGGGGVLQKQRNVYEILIYVFKFFIFFSRNFQSANKLCILYFVK